MKVAIIGKRYTLWQWQYSYDSPEGFHAWFSKDGKNIEVVTQNQKIQDVMLDSKSYNL